MTRQVQHSGAEDSWAPAKRASASFLGQSGHLVGLTDLRRGLVLEFNPVGDARRRRARRARTAGRTPAAAPSSAAASRWGITNNLNLNAHGEPGLLAGRVGRGPVPVRSAERALLLREAAVLPRRHRAVQHAQLADLHAAHRPADGRRQAHRQGIRHRHRAALRGGRSGRLARPATIHPVYNLLRLQRDVGAQSRARRGLHRPGRGQRLQPGGRRRRAAPLRRGVQRPAPAGGEPHPHRRRHDHGAALVRAVRPERPDLRLSLHRRTRAIRTSGPGAASSRARGCRTSTSIRG